MTTVVLSGVFEISRLYGGFFTSPQQLLEHQNWKFADALSYIKYAFVGVAINELSGLNLECEPASANCITEGETIMKQRGYDQYNISYLAGILAVYIVCARLVGYIGIRVQKY